MDTLRIGRRLEIVDIAKHTRNVRGSLCEEKIHQKWDFTEVALDTTNRYTSYLDTTSTVAVGAGGCLLTTAATNTKTATITCGGIYWLPSKNAIVEMRFEIDVITNVAIFAGFSDAASEASGLLPFGIVTATMTDTASNGAGFLFDTRQTASYFNIVQTKAGTDTFTQLASSYVPVAATRLTLRTELDSSGNATYYWNGKKVGYIANAVTAATNLVPFFGIRNNNASAHVATLRSVECWQDN